MNCENSQNRGFCSDSTDRGGKGRALGNFYRVKGCFVILPGLRFCELMRNCRGPGHDVLSEAACCYPFSLWRKSLHEHSSTNMDWGEKTTKKLTKKGKTTQKGFSNLLNKPLTKKMLIIFVGNWLLKALLKPLVSVGREWGFFGPPEAWWSLLLQKGRTEKHWRHSGEQIKMDHSLVLFFLAIIFFKRDYLKFSLL